MAEYQIVTDSNGLSPFYSKSVAASSGTKLKTLLDNAGVSSFSIRIGDDRLGYTSEDVESLGIDLDSSTFTYWRYMDTPDDNGNYKHTDNFSTTNSDDSQAYNGVPYANLFSDLSYSSESEIGFTITINVKVKASLQYIEEHCKYFSIIIGSNSYPINAVLSKTDLSGGTSYNGVSYQVTEISLTIDDGTVLGQVPNSLGGSTITTGNKNILYTSDNANVSSIVITNSINSILGDYDHNDVRNYSYLELGGSAHVVVDGMSQTYIHDSSKVNIDGNAKVYIHKNTAIMLSSSAEDSSLWGGGATQNPISIANAVLQVMDKAAISAEGGSYLHSADLAAAHFEGNSYFRIGSRVLNSQVKSKPDYHKAMASFIFENGYVNIGGTNSNNLGPYIRINPGVIDIGSSSPQVSYLCKVNSWAGDGVRSGVGRSTPYQPAIRIADAAYVEMSGGSAIQVKDGACAIFQGDCWFQIGGAVGDGTGHTPGAPIFCMEAGTFKMGSDSDDHVPYAEINGDSTFVMQGGWETGTGDPLLMAENTGLIFIGQHKSSRTRSSTPINLKGNTQWNNNAIDISTSTFGNPDEHQSTSICYPRIKIADDTTILMGGGNSRKGRNYIYVGAKDVNSGVNLIFQGNSHTEVSDNSYFQLGGVETVTFGNEDKNLRGSVFNSPIIKGYGPVRFQIAGDSNRNPYFILSGQPRTDQSLSTKANYIMSVRDGRTSSVGNFTTNSFLNNSTYDYDNFILDIAPTSSSYNDVSIKIDSVTITINGTETELLTEENLKDIISIQEDAYNSNYLYSSSSFEGVLATNCYIEEEDDVKYIMGYLYSSENNTYVKTKICTIDISDGILFGPILNTGSSFSGHRSDILARKIYIKIPTERGASNTIKVTTSTVDGNYIYTRTLYGCNENNNNTVNTIDTTLISVSSTKQSNSTIMSVPSREEVDQYFLGTTFSDYGVLALGVSSDESNTTGIDGGLSSSKGCVIIDPAVKDTGNTQFVFGGIDNGTSGANVSFTISELRQLKSLLQSNTIYYKGKAYSGINRRNRTGKYDWTPYLT